MSKPRPMLIDMPKSIKEKIIWSLEFKDRISCRHVCKQFNEISNAKEPIKIGSMLIRMRPDAVFVFIRGILGTFVPTRTGCSVQLGYKLEVIEGGDFFLEAREYLHHLFSCHVAIDRLEFDARYVSPGIEKLFDALSGHRIAIREIRTKYKTQAEHLVRMLGLIRRDALETATLDKVEFCGGLDMDKFCQLDVFEKVKDALMWEFEATRLNFDALVMFSQCDVKVKYLSAQDVRKIVQMFKTDASKTKMKIKVEKVQFEWPLRPEVQCTGYDYSATDNNSDRIVIMKGCFGKGMEFTSEQKQEPEIVYDDEDDDDDDSYDSEEGEDDEEEEEDDGEN